MLKNKSKIIHFLLYFKFPEHLDGTGLKRYHYFPKIVLLAINCSYDVIMLTFINLSCSKIGLHLKAKLKMSNLYLLRVESDKMN